MPYVLRGSLGEEYKIETQARIGRDPSNQIVLPDLLVSRMHATVMVEQGSFQLVDNGSANGTRVNDVPVKTSTLKPGDVVRFGNTPLTVDYLPDPTQSGISQTVVRSIDPYAGAPVQGYAPPQSVYSAPTYPMPAYVQPAQPYPQAPASSFGAPTYPSPPAAKKSRVGRILLIGCLLPIGLCVLLSLGGYVAFRAGLINLNTFGLGPGDITVANRRGEPIRVSILELSPPSGTAPIRGGLALKAPEARNYRVDVPGRYQIDFSLESSGALLGTCLLNVKSAGRYQFAALADAVTISLLDSAATQVDGQNIATSTLCR